MPEDTEYDNVTYVSAEEHGVVYEIEFNDRTEVRSMLSHAPRLNPAYFLEFLEGVGYDVDVNPLQMDDADANAENAIRNFDGVGSDD